MEPCDPFARNRGDTGEWCYLRYLLISRAFRLKFDGWQSTKKRQQKLVDNRPVSAILTKR